MVLQVYHERGLAYDDNLRISELILCVQIAGEVKSRGRFLDILNKFIDATDN
jgi:hypothetical protein